jgi:hypothetical protein
MVGPGEFVPLGSLHKLRLQLQLDFQRSAGRMEGDFISDQFASPYLRNPVVVTQVVIAQSWNVSPGSRWLYC